MIGKRKPRRRRLATHALCGLRPLEQGWEVLSRPRAALGHLSEDGGTWTLLHRAASVRGKGRGQRRGEGEWTHTCYDEKRGCCAALKHQLTCLALVRLHVLLVRAATPAADWGFCASKAVDVGNHLPRVGVKRPLVSQVPGFFYLQWWVQWCS